MTEQPPKPSWQKVVREREAAARAELRRRLVEAGIQFDAEPTADHPLGNTHFEITTPDGISVSIRPGLGLWGTRSNCWSRPSGAEPLVMKFQDLSYHTVSFREKKATGWDWGAIIPWCVKYVNDSIANKRNNRISEAKTQGWKGVAKALEARLGLEPYQLRHDSVGLYVQVSPRWASEAEADDGLRRLVEGGWVRAKPYAEEEPTPAEEK